MPDRFLLKGQERRQCLLEKEHGSHFTTEMLSLWLLEWQVTESLLTFEDLTLALLLSNVNAASF